MFACGLSPIGYQVIVLVTLHQWTCMIVSMGKYHEDGFGAPEHICDIPFRTKSLCLKNYEKSQLCTYARIISMYKFCKKYPSLSFLNKYKNVS
jgi:hypothetical protein